MTAPFVKRVGGKASKLARYRPLVPPDISGRLISPFLGGGALELDLLGRKPELPARAVLADLDAELIDAFLGVQRDPEGVCAALSRLEWTRESFTGQRDMGAAEISVLGLPERAARVIAINLMSFNGLTRRNARGESNQAFGDGRFDARRVPALGHKIRQASKALQGADISASDFEPVVSRASAGDFVFCDSPYDGDETFTGYNAQGFGAEDQERLARALRALGDRGGRFLACNADTERIRGLYEGFTIDTMPVRYSIAGSGAARRAVGEVLIRNYDAAARTISVAQVPQENMTGDEGATMQPEARMAQQGRRMSDADVSERTGYVAELLKQGVGRPEILKAFRSRFGAGTRTCDDYIRRVRESWAIEAVSAPSLAESRNRERGEFLSALQADVREAKTAGTWSAVASLRRLEAEVRGLRVLRPPAEPAASVSNTTNNVIVMSPEVREHKLGVLRRYLDRQSSQGSQVRAEGDELQETCDPGSEPAAPGRMTGADRDG